MRSDRNGFSRRLVLSGFVALTASAATPPGPPPRWLPPPQGAVEMFRQMPRAFAVGGGGAGGTKPRPAALPAAHDADVAVIHLAPQSTWDEPDGPTGRKLAEGTIFFYRSGDERPLVTARAGEPARLPGGDWWLMAEAPGFATTAANRLTVGEGSRGLYELLISVVPACRVALADDEKWAAIERLDIVSLTEHTVYPLFPQVDRARWVAAGELLAYSIDGEGRIEAMTPVSSCRAGDTVALPPPTPPANGRGILLVSFELPPRVAVQDRGEVRVTLTPAADDDSTPANGGAVVWQGSRAAVFFLGVADDASALLHVAHPRLAPIHLEIPPIEGVQSLDLGRLRTTED